MLALAPHPRNELGPLRGVKCTSNAENALAAAHAAQLGADDSILLNLAGSVCETASANIFWVRAGLLRTPSLQTGCLAGVTRDLLIQWARDSGWDVHETAEPVAALTTADEVFITSSLRQVQPVSHVLDAAGRPVWRRAGEGAAVAAISELFAARSNADWNPRRAAQ
jgi:branched-chain amino acid aminotransferase